MSRFSPSPGFLTSPLCLAILLTLGTESYAAAGGGAPLTKRSNWSVRNSVVHVDGEPFFPLGIYYVSYYSEQDERRMQDVGKIARAGFNMIYTPIDRNDGPFLDKCARLGIYVVVEFNDDPKVVIAAFGRHPAIAFYGTFDDVDSLNSKGEQRHPVSTVSSTNADTKSADRENLTYASGGHPTRIEPYLNVTDTLGFQTYPVPFEPLSSTHNALAHVRNLQEANGSGTPLIGNLQTFSWQNGGRLPTGEEVRNMTYQSLIAGVEGILYYTYFDPVTDLNMQPELWFQLKRLAREIDQISPFLVEGKRTVISTRDAWTFAAYWELDDELLLIVVNSHDRDAKEVSPRLPLKASATLADANRIKGRNQRRVRAGRKGVESLSSGELTLKLQPKEAQILQFNLR